MLTVFVILFQSKNLNCQGTGLWELSILPIFDGFLAGKFSHRRNFLSQLRDRKHSNLCLHYHYYQQSDIYLHFNTFSSSWESVRVRVSWVIKDIAKVWYFPTAEVIFLVFRAQYSASEAPHFFKTAFSLCYLYLIKQDMFQFFN